MPVQLFVPEDYVPLSDFGTDDGSVERLVMAVNPQILQYAADRGEAIHIARCSRDGEMHLEKAVAVNVEAGEITVSGGPGGIVVAVCSLFRNEFPVATNWDAGLNGDRGGPRAGASDAIGMLRLDRDTGEIAAELDLADNDPASPYLYATDRYALFAGEPDGAGERAAGFERYIGEAYSLYGVAEEAALLLSREALRSTGYPVMFRNVVASELKGVPELPLFQLLNNRMIGEEGSARSAASFILPPGWTNKPSEAYPCLFSGYYDLNDNVYRHCGAHLIKAIGRMMEKTGKSAVGILWNGGGSIGTRTQHPSAFGQLNLLFRAARDEYAVDPHAVVTVGGSRGGLTALLAACNPIAEGYSVRYALCYGVPFSIYGPAAHMLNVTYPARWEALCSDMGRKHAAVPGWRDAEGHSAIGRYMLNAFGTTDEEEIRSRWDPRSDRMLQALRDRGTQVLLNASTHDPFTAFWPALEWVSRARNFGIPLRQEIGYRHGHNNCTDLYDNAAACLEAIAEGREIRMEGTLHYRRSGEAMDRWMQTALFDPPVQPVFFEGPKYAVAGTGALLTVYGIPGMAYRLAIRSVREGGEGQDCERCDGIAEVERMREHFAAAEPMCDRGTADVKVERDHRAASAMEQVRTIVLMEGSLPMEGHGTPQCAYAVKMWEVPAAAVGEVWLYELSYCPDDGAGRWRVVPDEGVPHPGGGHMPELVVLAEAPDFTSAEWLGMTTSNFIGWGLSEV